MMYQLARIIQSDQFIYIMPIGNYLVWVQSERPQLIKLTAMNDSRWCQEHLSFLTNLIHTGKSIALPSEALELLPYFSNNVQPRAYEEWLRVGGEQLPPREAG